MFPCHKGNKASTNKSHEYFFSADIVNSHYMTSTRGHCFERNKENPSFRTNDDTTLCDVSLFCIFLLLKSSSFYLSSEICFPLIWFVFYVSSFYVTLKLFSLLHFNEIYFLERLRYLFNNTYIVRRSLVILYPC